jgi:DNA-binding MarR family transcriptional regulator
MVHGIIEDCGDSLERLQIEPKALFLMSVLDDNPEPAQLAKALLLPKPTVTFLIKRLEEEGYVKRANDTADLRK